jgi:hypothetical protein
LRPDCVGVPVGTLPQLPAGCVRPLGGVRVIGLPVQVAPPLLREPTVEGCLRPQSEDYRPQASSGPAPYLPRTNPVVARPFITE